MGQSVHEMVAVRVMSALHSLRMENIADEVLAEHLVCEIEIVDDGVMVSLPNVKKPSRRKASAAKVEPEAEEIEMIPAEDGSEDVEEADSDE